VQNQSEADNKGAESITHEANTLVLAHEQSDTASQSVDNDGYELSAECRKWTARRLYNMEHDPCK